MLERRNKELKRRTRVAGLFPNETSALRLVSAVALEISKEWETNSHAALGGTPTHENGCMQDRACLSRRHFQRNREYLKMEPD
jgi:hypothetical protein